ncbi:hypothetical protein BSLG_003192 [Batrachochytrium salamandrivorans]|nr:hypothetical protein BSLG_003192 [Batrachochytrium salamandrivorans]
MTCNMPIPTCLQLPANSVVDIPFWLAKPLALQAVVGLEVPSCFSEAVQDELTASPAAVKISLHCPFFFRFFADVLSILELPRPFIELVTKTFRARLRLLCDYTMTARLGADQSSFIQTLDATERHLYENGLQSEEALSAWQRREHVRCGTLRVNRQLQQQQKNKRRRMH